MVRLHVWLKEMQIKFVIKTMQASFIDKYRYHRCQFQLRKREFKTFSLRHKISLKHDEDKKRRKLITLRIFVDNL